eukprot:Skav201506  [mRNA]  locus=scaffold1154:297384:301058:+ [translate_table: standard]
MRRLQRGHPLNVFPLGNAFLDDQAQIRRNQGLGPQLVRLGDESLLQLLRWLDLETLGRMLRGFAAAEELWQPLVMAKFLASAGSEEVKERGFSFFYAATELNPSWLEAETLQRVGAELTTSEFVERFEEQSCPVIVEAWRLVRSGLGAMGAQEGCVKHWPALSRWSRETLVQRYGDVPFAAGAADFPLETFYAYAENNTDDVARQLTQGGMTGAGARCLMLAAARGQGCSKDFERLPKAAKQKKTLILKHPSSLHCVCIYALASWNFY